MSDLEDLDEFELVADTIETSARKLRAGKKNAQRLTDGAKKVPKW